MIIFVSHGHGPDLFAIGTDQAHLGIGVNPLTTYRRCLSRVTLYLREVKCRRRLSDARFVAIAIAALAGTLALSGCFEDASYAREGALPCTKPYIHDGDNIRCEEFGKGRLYGIDAPEMPGACRPGRSCTAGDPYESRDYLRSLVAKGNVVCRVLEQDHYGRSIARCWTDEGELSCLQIAAGHAVPRYGALQCPSSSRGPSAGE